MIRRPSGAPPPAARSGVLSVEAAGTLGSSDASRLRSTTRRPERALHAELLSRREGGDAARGSAATAVPRRRARRPPDRVRLCAPPPGAPASVTSVISALSCSRVGASSTVGLFLTPGGGLQWGPEGDPSMGRGSPAGRPDAEWPSRRYNTAMPLNLSSGVGALSEKLGALGYERVRRAVVGAVAQLLRHRLLFHRVQHAPAGMGGRPSWRWPAATWSPFSRWWPSGSGGAGSPPGSAGRA